MAGKFLGDVGLDRLGCREVGATAVAVAFAGLGKAASVERAGKLLIELQRRVIVLDRIVDLAELEIDEAAGVEYVGSVGLDLERRVAIRQRLLRLAGTIARTQQRALQASILFGCSRVTSP